jgi:excisionase family DNA binding protein
VEITVVAPGQWATKSHQLAALLVGASESRVIPDPSGAPAHPDNLAILTLAASWAADTPALAEALGFGNRQPAASPGTADTATSGAVSPVEDRLVYTVEEAAALLGISRSFAYEAVQRGEIPSMRIGKRILVPKAALERLLLSTAHSDPDDQSPT